MEKQYRRRDSRAVLARNLAILLERHDLSQHGLAQRTHGRVGQKTISNILAGTHSPKLETVDAIASVFNLSAWQIILPVASDMLGEHYDMLKILNDVVACYLDSTPDAQDYIATTARREHELRPKIPRNHNDSPPPSTS